MANHSEFGDYEPLSRRPNSKTAGAKADDNSTISPMRPGSSLRVAITSNDEQDWRSKKSTDPGVFIQERIPTQQKDSGSRIEENWSIKRGHGLSYLGLFLFTTVLFFRPYELFPSLSFFSTSAFWLGVLTLSVFIPTQLALEGTLTARPREVKLIVVLCMLALLSIPLAISPAESWLTFNDTFIKAVLIFIVIVNVVRTERRLYGLFFLALGVSCLLSVGAINDYRLGNLALQGRRIQGMIGGIFGNPNDLAIHLVTMFPIAVVIWLSARKLLVKGLCLLCAVLFVAGIVATYSRGGFLALVGAVLVLTWKLGRRQRVVTISLAILGAAALILLAPGDYGDRILSILGLSADSVGSASARKNLLLHSIYVALRNPFGVGMGNYHIMSAHEAVSHNAYTQVGAELGFVAMLVYVAFMIIPFRRLRQIERTAFSAAQRNRFYYLAIGLQASLVGYMIGSFFASVAYQWYVYYLVGYSIGLQRIYLGTLGPTKGDSAKEGELNTGAAVRLASPERTGATST